MDVKVFTEACARMVTLFPHSMFAERLVSAHNIVKSDLRSSLSRSTWNDYIFISTSMPPTAKFDPRPTIIRWFENKNRRPKSSNTLSKVEKYSSNAFVNSFFEK
jgi:hypothetical protein